MKSPRSAAACRSCFTTGSKVGGGGAAVDAGRWRVLQLAGREGQQQAKLAHAKCRIFTRSDVVVLPATRCARTSAECVGCTSAAASAKNK